MTTVRLAAAGDLDVVMPLVRRYFTEAHRAGNTDIQPTDRTMEFLRQITASYLEGEMVGACAVLASEKGLRGFSLAGELPPPPWDSDHGRSAFGWGTWVRADWRGHGWGTKLSLLVQERLRELGTETLLGGYRHGRPLAEVERIGFTPYQVLGYRRLV